ncbi:MAG: 50S ribosome-binding GTPase [Aeromicrobium erythreum]
MTEAPLNPRDAVVGRLEGLGRAVEAADGRLREDDLAAARELAERGSERLRLSAEHTIAALAGATGSGKSSIFNALTDLELAGVGVRRPTTSWALACAWGPEGAQELLEWMGIPARHQVSRMSMLDRSDEDQKLDGLVLLDLPDHDSTEVAHHVEMDRLVQHADLLVWVLDPQKYADAAIHDRYIRPMAAYSDVTIVVLNQIDRIHYEQRQRALDDVRRILAEEGLPDVPVLGVSATRGDGIDELKRELARRIRAKRSSRDRLVNDVAHAADELARVGGTSEVPGIGDVDEQALDLALLDAAGGPRLVQAVEASTRRRAVRCTGWPVARLLTRREDASALAELGLDEDLSPKQLSSAVPTASRVQGTRVDAAVRDLVDRASSGLERPWRDAVRDATLRESDALVAGLDEAVLGTDIGSTGTRFWWRLVQVLQWLLVLALVAGLGWLAAMLVDRFSSIDLVDPRQVLGVDLPVLLAVGGLVGGIVLALLSRVLVRFGARRRSRRAEASLAVAAQELGRAHVLDPVRAELERYDRFRRGVLAARS